MENDNLTQEQIANNVIESGLQLIPYVGSALAILYFGRKQQKEFNRLSNFYKELSDDLKKIEKISLDNQDEIKLAALIEKINNKVEKEVLQEKINYFKYYFKNILTNPVKDDYDEKVLFLDSLASMGILEIELLKFINSQSDFIQIGTIQKSETDQYVIVGAIGRLRNFGFLQSASGGMSIGGNDDNYLKERIKLSNFGRKFINFCLNI